MPFTTLCIPAGTQELVISKLVSLSLRPLCIGTMVSCACVVLCTLIHNFYFC